MKNYILGGILVLVLIAIAMSEKAPDEIIEIDMRFTIGDYIGLLVDTDKVYFGTFPKGDTQSRTREVTIVNHQNIKKELSLEIAGNFSEDILIPTDIIILGPNSNITFDVILTNPKHLDYGSYETKLRANIKYI